MQRSTVDHVGATIILRDRDERTHEDRQVSGTIREGEMVQDAVVRLYPKLTGRRGRKIGLWQDFGGGGTYHVQMGQRLRGERGMSLDSTVVVQVYDNDAR